MKCYEPYTCCTAQSKPIRTYLTCLICSNVVQSFNQWDFTMGGTLGQLTTPQKKKPSDSQNVILLVAFVKKIYIKKRTFYCFIVSLLVKKQC